MANIAKYRRYALNGKTEKKGQNDWHGYWESPTWLDSKAFRSYAMAVKTIIENAAAPVCTREIHTALGEAARVEWTADVLEWLGVEKVGILPTRYRMCQYHPAVAGGDSADGNT